VLRTIQLEGLWGLGDESPQEKKNGLFLAGFRQMVFVNGFLILVKELGLLDNLGQCIRVLDAAGSYMCIVL
jgi:hypothetical protein